MRRLREPRANRMRSTPAGMSVPRTSAPAATIPSRSRSEATPPTNTGTSATPHQRGEFLLDHAFRWRECRRQHDGIAPRATCRERQVIERRLRGKHHHTQSALVRGEREDQQAEFMLFVGQAGGEDARTGTRSRAVMKARTQLVAHKGREEVLLGDAALAGFPSAPQFLQDGQQQAIGHGFDRIQAQRLRIHLFELIVVVPRDCSHDAIAVRVPRALLLPPRVGRRVLRARVQPG